MWKKTGRIFSVKKFGNAKTVRILERKMTTRKRKFGNREYALPSPFVFSVHPFLQFGIFLLLRCISIELDFMTDFIAKTLVNAGGHGKAGRKNRLFFQFQ